MSAPDSTALLVTRGLGTAVVGLMAGFTVTVGFNQIPALFEVSTLSPRDRVHLWSKAFDRGLKMIAILLPPVIVLFSSAAYYAVPPPLWGPANWVAKNRKLVLGAVAALTGISVPYTGIVMAPGIQQLKNVEKKLIADAAENNAVIETDALIISWLRQHYVRIAMAVAAFGLAVAELVSV